MPDPIAIMSAVEALLFVAGEPVKIRKLAKSAGCTDAEARTALAALASAHEERKGLRVLIKDDEAELVTHPNAAAAVAEYVKSGMEEDLTDATAETLAIVAYKGPIGRAAIDDIRGVNSQYTLRALLVRGLVERLPNPTDSRTYIYRVSMDFLKKLGLASVEELPDFAALSIATLTQQHDAGQVLPEGFAPASPVSDVPASEMPSPLASSEAVSAEHASSPDVLPAP